MRDNTINLVASPNLQRNSTLYPSLDAEILQSFYRYKLWLYLAWSDIRQRYRGSFLGPLWITLSTFIFVVALSVINSELFKVPAERYIPALSGGFIMWYFISGTISECTSALVASKGLITQIRLPFFVHILRVVARNLIIFLHNAVVHVGVLLWFKINPFPMLFFLIPGLILSSLILLNIGMVLAMIGARYRDIQQLVASLLQVLFFVSPITWEARQITQAKWVVEWNPVFYCLEVTRGPLNGHVPGSFSWYVMASMVVVTSIVCVWIFGRKRERIAYWVQ